MYFEKTTAIVCKISADYSTVMTHLLNVCCYNMRGFNSTKIPYVTDLLNRFPILFLIEHWLNNKQLSHLSANFRGYSISGVSAIPDGNLLRGRPYILCYISRLLQ